MRFPGWKNVLKYVCDRGSAQDPAGGAYSAVQDDITGLKGAHF